MTVINWFPLLKYNKSHNIFLQNGEKKKKKKKKKSHDDDDE